MQIVLATRDGVLGTRSTRGNTWLHVGSRWADNEETLTLCRPHLSFLYLLSDSGPTILWRSVHVSVYSNIWPLSPKMQCLKETLLSPLIWYWYRFWRHNAIEKITYSGLSLVLCPLSKLCVSKSLQTLDVSQQLRFKHLNWSPGPRLWADSTYRVFQTILIFVALVIRTLCTRNAQQWDVQTSYFSFLMSLNCPN